MLRSLLLVACLGMGLGPRLAAKDFKLPVAAAVRPLAHFRFDGSAVVNRGQGEARFELRNTELRDNALYLNGVYDGGPGGGFKAVCRTPGINYDGFAVAVRFKAEDFEGNKCNVVTGGTSYRWFGMQRSKAGNLMVTLNNQNFSHEVLGAALEKGKWNVVACSVDIPGRKVLTFLNGRIVPEIKLPPDFMLRVVASNVRETDKAWSFTNYSNGTVLHGLVEELLIYDRSLSTSELGVVPLRP